MQEQMYNAKDHRKDFMIYYNESDLQRPGIKPGRPINSPTFYQLS
jgi:hypothetical protein